MAHRHASERSAAAALSAVGGEGLAEARDGELRSWMDAWQGGAGAEGHGETRGEEAARMGVSARERQRLRRRMRRWTWWMVFQGVSDVVLSVGLSAWVISRVWTRGEALDWVLLILVQAILLVAVGFTWWNRRGTWRPENHSTRAYLGLEILRARRKLKAAARIVPLLLLFETALLVPWKLWQISLRPGVNGAPPPDLLTAAQPVLVFMVAFSAVVLLSCWLMARRFRAELEALLALREQLEGDGEDPGL